MRRRAVLAGAGASAVAALAGRARAQAMRSVGYLYSGTMASFEDNLATLKRGLAEAGYREGATVAFVPRWGDGAYDRLPALAAELVARPVDVIVTVSLSAVQAVRAATHEIPIVFSVGVDPVEFGLVGSLNRPGGNLTGVVNARTAVVGKRVQVLHELLPATPTLAVLGNPANPNVSATLQIIRAAAAPRAQSVSLLEARDDEAIERAFATLAGRDTAIVLIQDPFFISRRDQIVAAAARHRVPAVYDRREFVLAGGLMSYGVSQAEIDGHLARYAARILDGAKPADLPVVQPTKFELAVNLNTARTLGIAIPPTLLGAADEVIE